MLQIQTIRENPDFVVQRLAVKNVDAAAMIGQIIDLDRQKRNLQQQLDNMLSEGNRISKAIPLLMKEGKKEEAETLKQHSQEIKGKVKGFSEKMSSVEQEIIDLMLRIPNLPHKDVPPGRTAEQNEEVFSWGEIPTLSPDALPHWELAAKYRIIDFDLGAKVTGSGFPFYIGKGAKLQRALISFFLDKAVEAGYLEYQPPLLVNEDSAFGTGQLPDKEGQMYSTAEEKFYLIPTAEVPLTNIFRDVILKQDELPVRLCGYSSCFRREAGSYGKDVRGLNRLHQFDKVEIVQIANPETSYQHLEEMRDHVTGLVQGLGLPVRILRLCGGDMSFASAMTYDFEVYSAAQKRWLEVSSVSNFEAFQANRLKLRFKDSMGKIRLAHTLNGSALALPRIMAAILENNQHPHGIRIPEVLITYTGFRDIF